MAAAKVRVVHPEFSDTVRTVSADQVEAWLAAGWVKEKSASRSSLPPAKKATARKSSRSGGSS